MCKCFQNCLEACYWHIIEKRFCYDESIALYEPPGKEEKNNNCFDNMAFYDSVSVIAGRAIVTIEPLPEQKPIVQQPTRRLRWEPELECLDREHLSKSVPIIPIIYERDEKDSEEEDKPKEEVHPKEITDSQSEQRDKSQLETLKPENLDPHVENRRRSLIARRMSKSLYLKIDQPKEIPIIRQMSMPKFYLETPVEHEQATFSFFRTPSVALSPVPKSSPFVFDLQSVVQIEREKEHQRSTLATPVHRKDSERSSRILQIKDKIKLRRAKSSLGTPVTNLPHSHNHI